MSDHRECPFCTSKKIVFVSTGERDGSGWMMCDGCRSTGPTGKDETEARKFWNWGIKVEGATS